MSRDPLETHFQVTISEATVEVFFWPTKSQYTFNRFALSKDIAEFGSLSPDPLVRHASARRGTGHYSAAEVQALAFRLALSALEER
jgi:hypothetical protein